MNETTRTRFAQWISDALAGADCWVCESWGITTAATSPPGERPTCDACRSMPLPITSGAPLIQGDVTEWGMAK